MMHQCSVFTTKAQYDKSIILLENVLSLDSTRDALGLQCVDAIQVLMNKLVGKERYLAYHIRRHATMSQDAMTTSAVESMNFVTKKQMGLNSNMNISRALTGMAEEHDDRYIRHRQNSMRLLGKINRSSQSPTKAEIHPKCQYMIDQNFDLALKPESKCARVGDEEWLCWCFPVEKEEDKKPDIPWKYFTRFVEVHRLHTKRTKGDVYLHCSCLHHQRCGFPCEHFFKVIPQISHSMVNIQFWLTYHPYYGENNDIGYALMQAQTNQITVANCGVPISKEMLHTAKKFPEEINAPGEKVTYQILLCSTSKRDYDMATFAMNKDCCTEQ